MKYEISPRLKNLLPAQTESERAACSEGIKKAGKADPGRYYVERLTGKKVLIDGHNRLEICTALGLPFEAELVREVTTEAEAVRWMLSYQAGRRNVTKDQMLAHCVLSGGNIGDLGANECEARALKNLYDNSIPMLEEVKTGRKSLVGASAAVTAERNKAEQQARKLAEGGPVILTAHAVDFTPSAVKPVEAGETTGLVYIAPHIQPVIRGPKHLAYIVSLMSDVHAGSEFVAGSGYGNNAYNRGICELRLHKYFRDLKHWIETLSPSWQTQGLVQWLGGDLVNGSLHPEVQDSNETAIATMQWFRPLLFEEFDNLADFLVEKNMKLRLLGSYGNHSRTIDKPAISNPWAVSVEFDFYQLLAQRCLDKYGSLVEYIDVSKDPHQYTELYSKRLHFTHGDRGRKFQGAKAGISLTMQNNLDTWERSPTTKSAVHHVGHYHWHFFDEGQGYFVNGSVVGASEYGDSKGMKALQAKQWVYVFDEELGAVSANLIVLNSEKQRMAERKAGLG